MHQTTIRFGTDLWDALSRAAEQQGTSVAQYVREAAVARMAQGDSPALPMPDARRIADSDRRRAAGGGAFAARGAAARSASRDQADDSLAVWAQGRQARARARAIREEAARIRAQRPVSPDVLLRLRADRVRRGELDAGVAAAAHAGVLPGRHVDARGGEPHASAAPRPHATSRRA